MSLGISSFSQPDAHLDMGRGLMGWVLRAVGVGDALGDPARSVTGDGSGHQCQHMGAREGHTALVEDRHPVGQLTLLFSKLIPSSQKTHPPS